MWGVASIPGVFAHVTLTPPYRQDPCRDSSIFLRSGTGQFGRESDQIVL